MERIKFIKGLSPEDFMAKRNDYITELISLKNYLKYGWINKAALVALARPRKNSKKPGSVVVGKPLPQGLKLGGAQKFVVHVGPGRWGKGKGRNTMVYYDGTNRVFSMPKTSQLFRHLRLNPSARCNADLAELEGSSAHAGTKFYATRMKRKALLPHHVRYAKMILETGSPFTLGDHPAFRAYTMGLSGNAATPPSKETVKKILAIMLDLMEQNMRKRIAAVKARYGGIAFVGLSADTWSSRRSQGFIAIEISFAYFPGSHTKEAIAEVMRDALAKFGLDAEDVIVYVSDSGGGIPAAAKVLGLFRLACMLHLLDTITGRALGVKGLGSGARARPHGEGAHLLKEYLGRAKDQAGYWKNSNLRTEQLQEAHKENEEEREALAILLGDETVTVTPLPHVQQPVASRMWSDCAMLASINKLQRSFDKFYEKFGGAKQLPFNDRVLTPYIVSLLMVIRNAQKAVEASTYPTASFYFVIIHDLKAYYNGKSFRIYLNPNDKRATTVALTDMPQLAQYLVKNIAMELDYYFPTVQKQVAMAAFADPRVKWHPALVDHLDDLGEEFEGLLVKVLEPMLSDDPGLNGDAIDEDAVTEAGPQQVVYRSTIDALFGDDEPIVRAPTACAAPRAAAVPKPKSSHSKAVELAAQIKAWHLALPKVEKVVYGKGSGDFNVLDHISKQSLGLGKEADDAYKIVVMSLLGFRASAAGPETIFSLCGLICTALRNRISVWNIELLVFLSKNKEFIPSDDEVVEEILRLEKIQKTRKAAAAEPQNEANESEDEVYDVYDGDEEVGADGDGEVHDDCEGEEEDSDESDDGETEVELPSDVVVDRDPRPLILTEDEISGLYDDITQPRLNRGGGCDAEFEFEDFFDELMEKELGPGI